MSRKTGVTAANVSHTEAYTIYDHVFLKALRSVSRVFSVTQLTRPFWSRWRAGDTGDEGAFALQKPHGRLTFSLETVVCHAWPTVGCRMDPIASAPEAILPSPQFGERLDPVSRDVSEAGGDGVAHGRRVAAQERIGRGFQRDRAGQGGFRCGAQRADFSDAFA